MLKLLLWLPKNLASILGIIQAVLKLIKEILTAVVNILYPLIPSAKFQKVVDTVRGIVNKVDEVVQRVKDFLLKVGG